MLGLDAIVAGAVAVLIVSMVGRRWAPRVRGAASVESAAVARVHGGRVRQDQGHESRVLDPGGRVLGPGVRTDHQQNEAATRYNSRAIPPPAQRGMAILPADEHVDRFIAWAITDEDGITHRVRFRHKQTAANYRMWAERHCVHPLAELVFLSALAKHPQVKKTRDRVKDPQTGRVVILPSGSPMREMQYIITPSRAEAKRRAPSAPDVARTQGACVPFMEPMKVAA